MAREQLFELHQRMCSKAFKIMEVKNHDYAGPGADDPFANFRRSEAMGICSAERAMLSKMVDKSVDFPRLRRREI